MSEITLLVHHNNAQSNIQCLILKPPGFYAIRPHPCQHWVLREMCSYFEGAPFDPGGEFMVSVGDKKEHSALVPVSLMLIVIRSSISLQN